MSRSFRSSRFPEKRSRAGVNTRLAPRHALQLPPAGWVSILHLISGAAMFLLLSSPGRSGAGTFCRVAKSRDGS